MRKDGATLRLSERQLVGLACIAGTMNFRVIINNAIDKAKLNDAHHYFTHQEGQEFADLILDAYSPNPSRKVGK